MPTPISQSSQRQQGFPRQDQPVVDPETGRITQAWYRLLVTLWQKLGGSFSLSDSTLYIQQTGTAGATLYDSLTGQQLGPGPVSFGNVTGSAQANVAIGASPVTLAAAGDGTLVISGGGQTEIRRPPAAFVVASLVGGIVPVLTGDEVRLTWFVGPAPVVTFLPFTIG